MANKLTTRDLIGNLISLEIDKEMLELSSSEGDNDEEIASIVQSIDDAKQLIAKKTSGIDHFIVEMNKRTNLIDAEIDTLMDEIKRLRNHKKAIKKTEEYFNKELIPMIVETAGNDGIFETSTTRYKLYETWGPIEVTNAEVIPDKYKRYKVEIDKKGARKDIIEAAENGMGISGFSIQKTKRIRRS
tara:strand:+ start:3675 stop:4235 length:561 start_codon:yes stop_codon:yes gene_type:complete